MDLWIRTQDKKDLIKVDYISYEIAIEDKHILWYKSIDLGTYKTEERALEVLDKIETKMAYINDEYVAGHNNLMIFEMPKE